MVASYTPGVAKNELLSADALLNDRIEEYVVVMSERYREYLEMYFPEVDGERQPIFTEQIDEREELLRLREARHKAELVAQGQMEPDLDAMLYARNADGAQQRLVELAMRFNEEI